MLEAFSLIIWFSKAAGTKISQSFSKISQLPNCSASIYSVTDFLQDFNS
jgi:hypothetical protein